MNIKMIVMDMDGTLLNQDQIISERTLNALFKAQDNEVILVLASGRSYKTLKPYGDILEMSKHKGHFICVNGAAIYDTVTNVNHVIKRLQLDEIKEIFEVCKPFEIETMAVLESSIYDYIPESLLELKKKYRQENNIDEDVPMTAGTFRMIVDQRKNYSHIEFIKDYTGVITPVNKICLAHTPEYLVKPYEYLLGKLSHKYNFNRTSYSWIEVMPKDISKGNAVKKLAQENNIQLDEILVFGDGENDLSMFEVVKYSVAMGNAMETVKQAAHFITDTNNNDGIAKILEEYVL